MNWKGCGKKRLWFIFKVISRNFPGGAEKTHARKPSVSIAGLRAEILTQDLLNIKKRY
jgi:hypothetical protein